MLKLGTYPLLHTKVNVSPDLTGPTGLTAFKWEIPSGNLQDPEEMFTMIFQLRSPLYFIVVNEKKHIKNEQ